MDTTDQHSQEDGERRGYFRLNCDMRVSCKLIDDALLNDTELQDASSVSPYDAQFKAPPHARMLNELSRVELETQSLWRTIHQDNRHIAKYLKLLNQKIDCMAQWMQQNAADSSDSPLRSVSISEGGLSFALQAQDTPWQTGQAVHLILSFCDTPGAYTFAAVGRIVHQQASEERSDETKVGIEFTHIEETDAHLLSRHITHEQSRRLRERKGETDR